jgi:hypothetical protein
MLEYGGQEARDDRSEDGSGCGDRGYQVGDVCRGCRWHAHRLAAATASKRCKHYSEPVLASLLPGLRDFRTPLATGYLWVVALWLILHDWVPKTVEQATGPIRSLYELSSLLGTTVTLAAISFVAYLLGVMLRWRFITNAGRIVLVSELPNPRICIGWLVWLRFLSPFRERARSMFDQLFYSTIEQARGIEDVLDPDEHADLMHNNPARVLILNSRRDFPPILKAYSIATASEFEEVGIQLQVKNRDFWDTYDREMAEAHFRFGITPPIVVIICLLAYQSGNLWWLLLLAAPIILFILAVRHATQAAATLVQAVVLKMVEPPVLERLREAAAERKQQAKSGPLIRSQLPGR